MMDPAWIKVLSKSGFKENLDDKAVGKMEDTSGLKLGLTGLTEHLFSVEHWPDIRPDISETWHRNIC